MIQRRVTLFDVLNYSFLFVLTLLTLYPFWTTLVVATSSSEGFFSSFYHVIPNSFSLESFAEALSLPTIYTSFAVSVLVTVCGTALSLFLTSMGAYVLSKGDLEGRNFMFRMIIFTMFFSGGLVPFYILLTQMGLRNNILVLFVPNALNTFNMILMKNYFATSVPQSLEDSARIDGLNDFQILFRIVLPTSMPIVATISLFYSVGYWNNWFMAMLFMSNDKLLPLALVMRNLVQSARSLYVPPTVVPQMVKAAVIIISIVPIVMVYPFIQKHFVKGIMLGAIKE
jgi:putative aldouronate transport system permease protein